MSQPLLQARILTGIFIIFLTAFPSAAHAGGDYHLSKNIPVSGTGRWDYLTADDATRRVYVSHGTEVDVLDADKGTIVGTIGPLQGVHGIALAPDLGRGFISDGHDDSVIVFDLKTLKILTKVSAGKNPDAIVYEPVTHKVFAFNGGSGTSTIIDAGKAQAIVTIDLGGRPEFAAVDGKGHVFDDLEDKNAIIKIDANTQTVTEHWPSAPGEEPASIAIDSKNHRLFVGCHNQMLIILDTDTGKIITHLPIGEGVDATVFDPKTSLVISTSGDGTMTVIHEDAPDKYHIVKTIETQKRSRTLALDKKTHRLFLPAAQFTTAPVPTPDNPHPRPSVIPGSFSILVFDAAD